MYLVVFYVGKYVWVYVVYVVYTKSKSSELSPLRRKLLRFAKQFPPPLRSNNLGQTKVKTGPVLTLISGVRTLLEVFPVHEWNPKKKHS
jgi:hypothetical protein